MDRWYFLVHRVVLKPFWLHLDELVLWVILLFLWYILALVFTFNVRMGVAALFYLRNAFFDWMKIWHLILTNLLWIYRVFAFTEIAMGLLSDDAIFVGCSIEVWWWWNICRGTLLPALSKLFWFLRVVCWVPFYQFFSLLTTFSLEFSCFLLTFINKATFLLLISNIYITCCTIHTWLHHRLIPHRSVPQVPSFNLV